MSGGEVIRGQAAKLRDTYCNCLSCVLWQRDVYQTSVTYCALWVIQSMARKLLPVTPGLPQSQSDSLSIDPSNGSSHLS